MASRGKIWNSKRIADEIARIDNGSPNADYSPFYDGDTTMKAADIVFEYSQLEIEELARCAADVVYFGEKYCFSMTDEGIRQIKLRPYQKKMLKDFQENRFNVMLASRQIGKCALYDTKIDIKTPTGDVKRMSVGSLYFYMVSENRKLTFIEKLKYTLWKLYDKLN